MPNTPSIAVEETPDGLQRLNLIGDISVYHAAELHRAAMGLAEKDRDIVLNCRNLQSFDLAAGQILLALQRAASLRGRKFLVEGASRDAAELLSLVGLGEDPLPAAARRTNADGEGCLHHVTCSQS